MYTNHSNLFYSAEVPQQEMSSKERKYMLMMGVAYIAIFALFFLLI